MNNVISGWIENPEQHVNQGEKAIIVRWDITSGGFDALLLVQTQEKSFTTTTSN